MQWHVKAIKTNATGKCKAAEANYNELCGLVLKITTGKVRSRQKQWQTRAALTMRRMSNAAMRGRTMDGLTVCLSVCLHVRITDLATALQRVVMRVKQDRYKREAGNVDKLVNTL